MHCKPILIPVQRSLSLRQAMYMIALSLYLFTWISITAGAYKPMNFSDMKADDGLAFPITFPISGNIYPNGSYNVNISIGDDSPPKYSYLLDVDTGNDLTWVRCSDDPNNLYDPVAKGTVVKCGDHACKSLWHLGHVNPGIIFDSGSTYTYLASEAYGNLLHRIKLYLAGELGDAPEDKTLPVCWKDEEEPIDTIDDVSSYFVTLALRMRGANNNIVEFEMPLESYLIISDQHNVCLGILNGTQFGLKHKNVIGAISMQNKLVMYNNGDGVVGWVDGENCTMNQ